MKKVKKKINKKMHIIVVNQLQFEKLSFITDDNLSKNDEKNLKKSQFWWNKMKNAVKKFTCDLSF